MPRVSVSTVWFLREGAAKIELGAADALTAAQAEAVATMIAKVRNPVMLARSKGSRDDHPVGCDCDLACDIREMKRLHAERRNHVAT